MTTSPGEHRISIRTPVVTDVATKRRFALEGKCLGRHGVAAVIQALEMKP